MLANPLDMHDDAERLDRDGKMLLSGLVDEHIHRDKTLIGLPVIPHIPGETVAERTDAERNLRRTIAQVGKLE